MARTVITQTSAFLAVLAGIFLSNDVETILEQPWKLNLGVLVVIAALAAALWEIVGASKSRPVRFSGHRRDEKILKYMLGMLRTQAHLVISSNDLSWVKGEARHALFEKASHSSLTLLMPCANDLSSDLVSKGAVAYYYGDDEFRFASRFTLVNHSRSDAWVAIGHGAKNEHTIRTIDSKDDPAIHLADDLFRLVRRNAAREASVE